jgi:uncharacterized membrane protein
VNKVLLSIHVLAAIIFIGPVTVAVSLFPRFARTAMAGTDTAARAREVVVLLHRISRVYSVLGLSVPVVGLALAMRMGVLGDAWLVTAIVIVMAAAGVLAFLVLPAQYAAMGALDATGPEGDAARAGWLAGANRHTGVAGVFALMWTVVVVLMVFRPGSTTGV